MNKTIIEYDGQFCTSRCGNDMDCPHIEIHAEHLRDLFEVSGFEDREKIINYLSKEDFEDTVREIMNARCWMCYGTGSDGENEDGEERSCICRLQEEDQNRADAMMNLHE